MNAGAGGQFTYTSPAQDVYQPRTMCSLGAEEGKSRGGILTTHCDHRIRMLPITLAAIIFCTAVPIEFRGPVTWSNEFDIEDFVNNVLLYAPLGLALWRRPLLCSLASAAILSTVIEIMQIWHFERFASAVDVLANILGTACGILMARQLVQSGHGPPELLPINQRLTAFAILGVVMLLALWIVPAHSTNLSNWNPDFELLLGNERTSDRPWKGTLSELALVPAPLSSSEVHDLWDVADSSARTSLLSREAYVLPDAITLNGREATRLSPDVSRGFFHSATTRNGFTLIATVMTANVHQNGPARLISFSADQFNRNFDLGQEDTRLVFRVRTLLTDPNGMHPHAETSPVLMAQRPIFVVATFDGAVSRVYVDGQARGRSNLAAAGCLIPMLCDTGVPITSTLFGGLCAIAAIGILRPASRRSAMILAILAGILSTVPLYPMTESLPLGVGKLVLVLVGAMTVALAISRHLQPIESER